jgi:uncharacterized membrane protein YkoI
MFKQRLVKTAAVAAMAIGLGAGSYGIAAAASGGSAGAAAATTTAAAPPSSGRPWGGQRSDETPLTGDTLAKVQAAAVAKAGTGATVVRAETDADGNATYEVHMVKADGTRETVYVDGSFTVVSVETR